MIGDTETSAIDGFRAEMREHGLQPNERIVGDGEFHRFYVDGDRKGSKNGWYRLFIDGTPAGCFGSFKGVGTIKWSAGKSKQLSPEERKVYLDAMRQRKAERDAAQRAEWLAAAEWAQRQWDAAKDSDDHPYLTKKGVKVIGLRVGAFERMGEHGPYVASNNALLVPIRDAHRRIQSLQAIFDDPDNPGTFLKSYLQGGKKAGHYFGIGQPRDGVVIICEGVATGLSIHACTGHAVAVAFDTSNLLPVAKLMRAKFPDWTIVMAADNDRWSTEGKNPGVHYATAAALAISGIVAIPEFADSRTRPTDFNDLQQLEGIEAVNKIVAASIGAARIRLPDK